MTAAHVLLAPGVQSVQPADHPDPGGVPVRVTVCTDGSAHSTSSHCCVTSTSRVQSDPQLITSPVVPPSVTDPADRVTVSVCQTVIVYGPPPPPPHSVGSLQI